MRLLLTFAFGVATSLMTYPGAYVEGCSRLTYTGPQNTVVVGRSFDWMEDVHTDLWSFPVGTSRKGSSGANSSEWTSKYGSLIADGYHMGTTDGINAKGLVANLLYLATADYGTARPEQKTLSVLNWAQYVLDNYATVDEAVREYGKNDFHMDAPLLPDGTYPGVHLAISDASGDNAIFEYIGGKLVVYHGKEYTVMTNEPSYDKQLALNDYWKGLHGAFLPGTTEPSDRFIRASYYLGQAPSTADLQQSIATVFSIVRNVSQPIMKANSTRPNQAPTIWRSVADAKNLVYYFESTERPNVFWVDLNKLNLNRDAPMKKLPLGEGEIYVGEVSGSFVEGRPLFIPK